MLSVYKVYIINKNNSGVEKWYSQENTVTTKKDLYRSVVNTYELNNVQQFKQHILGHTSSSVSLVAAVFSFFTPNIQYICTVTTNMIIQTAICVPCQALA